MKFTRHIRYHAGEVQESEQCGIGAMLLVEFGKRIPKYRSVRFDSVLEIDSVNNIYDIHLEQYNIPRDEIIKFMTRIGCQLTDSRPRE